MPHIFLLDDPHIKERLLLEVKTEINKLYSLLVIPSFELDNGLEKMGIAQLDQLADILTIGRAKIEMAITYIGDKGDEQK